MSAPEISVLLPVLDGMPLLPRAVDSILNQSLHNLELLVIDDGSHDEGPAWLRQKAGEDPRLRFLPAEGPAGIAHALNRGLEQARGRWIARMDHDDVSSPGRLEAQLDLAMQKELDLVSCRVKGLHCEPGFSRYISWQNTLISLGQIEVARFIESPLIHPTVLFRREVAELHGSWRQGEFPEDYELWLRWLDKGVRMAKHPELLFSWQDSQDRLTRQDSRYDEVRFDALRAQYLDRFLRSNERMHHGRALWVWGAGPRSRKRLAPLQELGWRIQVFVDVSTGRIGQKIGGTKVVEPSAVGLQKPRPFVLAMVAVPGAREQIAAYLEDLGFVEGQDWLAAS